MRRRVDNDVTAQFVGAKVQFLTHTALPIGAEEFVRVAQNGCCSSEKKPFARVVPRQPLPRHNDMKPLVVLVDSLERQRGERRVVDELHPWPFS
jgi:hypothetical protein